MVFDLLRFLLGGDFENLPRTGTGVELKPKDYNISVGQTPRDNVVGVLCL